MDMIDKIKKRLFGEEEKIYRIRGGLGRGLKLFLNPSTQIQRILGLEEIELASYFRKFIPVSKTFVDIGAAYGFYSLAVTSIDDSIKVIWCDCWPDQKDKFERNLKINEIRDPNRIKVMNVGIGKAHTPLDSILNSCIEPVLCKIDVEKNELDVLESGQKSLREKKCTLILETHSLQLEQDCEALLHKIGYKTKIVKNAWWRLLIPEGRPMAHNRWIIAEK